MPAVKIKRLDIVEHDSYKIHKTLQTKLHKTALQQQMEETLMPNPALFYPKNKFPTRL